MSLKVGPCHLFSPAHPKQHHSLFDDHSWELKKQLRGLLEKGYILPSESPIAAPVFFAGEHDGSL